MYNIPSENNVTKVVLDESAINGDTDPIKIYENTEQQKALPDE